MTIQTVIRDFSGKVINIGPWDYMEEVLEDIETGVSQTVQHNPYPEGASEAEEEIVTLEDGGLAAVEEVLGG